MENIYPVIILFCIRIFPIVFICGMFILAILFIGICIIIEIILRWFGCIVIDEFEGNIIQRANSLIHNQTRNKEFVEDIGIVEEIECCICRNNPPNSLIKPCNHNSFCDSCLQMIDKCPLCRKDIMTVQVLKPGFFAVVNQSHPKDKNDIESQIEDNIEYQIKDNKNNI